MWTEIYLAQCDKMQSIPNLASSSETMNFFSCLEKVSTDVLVKSGKNVDVNSVFFYSCILGENNFRCPTYFSHSTAD